jgi:hypothetical protein
MLRTTACTMSRAGSLGASTVDGTLDLADSINA